MSFNVIRENIIALDFVKRPQTQLIPNLPVKPALVLGNETYHNVQEDKVLSHSGSKRRCNEKLAVTKSATVYSKNF